MVESPPSDKAAQLAWVARRTVHELHAAEVPLDAEAVYQGIVATYAHYNVDAELLERLRLYVGRWVERVSMGSGPRHH